MTEIWEFPTGNYTIFALVSVVCMIVFITSYLGYATDVEETFNVSHVLYVQEDILPTEPIYVVTLKIVDCFVRSGSTDIIIRVRGSVKNGPLLLFRDYEGHVEDRTTINIGFSVPFQLGQLMALEIAVDHGRMDEGYSVFSFSDLFVRKLPRTAAALANSNTRDILQSGGTPFEALSSYVRTWASMETLVSSKGIRIVGVPTNRDGRVWTVRAREAPVELQLVEENASMKAAARIGFRPLHYMWSQLRSWHEEWSDYSQFDQQMIMCLDLLATIVSVSCCFAFGVERFIGAYWVADNLIGSVAMSPAGASTIEEFNVPDLVQDISSSVIPLIVMTYMAIVASTFVIPLSLLWSRLFRMIGGKEFEAALDLAQNTTYKRRRRSTMPRGHRGIPRLSARQGNCSTSMIKDEIIDGSSIILRTLEVKNTYTGRCGSF